MLCALGAKSPGKHFEMTERSDWLEYRFEFMIDRKVSLVFIQEIGIN